MQTKDRAGHGTTRFQVAAKAEKLHLHLQPLNSFFLLELVSQGAGVRRGVWNFLLLLGRSAVALTRKERDWEAGVQPQGRGLRSRPGLSPGAPVTAAFHPRAVPRYHRDQEPHHRQRGTKEIRKGESGEGFLGNTKANRWRYNAASRRKPLPEARAERRQLPCLLLSPGPLASSGAGSSS